MISKDDQKRLIALCDHSINSGDDVILAHLLDALNTVIPEMSQYQQLEPIGKLGGWSIDSFL